jgi:small-conductance mechanosensitive channel
MDRLFTPRNLEGATDAFIVFLLALAAGFLFHMVAFWILVKVTKRTSLTWDDLIPVHLESPMRIVSIAMFLQIARPMMELPESVAPMLSQILNILFIVGGAWLLVRSTSLLRDILLLRVDINAADNLRSRKVLTQIKVFQNVLISIVVLVAGAMVLMTFQEVRQIGVSLLASAGIAGIVIGFAAQKTLGNLLAGLQLAITQPIRLDDVVIVEGEWGWIEEITLTYVVVKIWDLRRLVVPISNFIEKPFQNWTRSTSDILGTVMLHCDPMADMAVLRAEMDRIVKASPLWDGKVCGLQVTEAKMDSVEVRLLVSSSDSPRSWDLRCALREGMLAFLRDAHPGWLAHHRLLHEPPAPATNRTGSV